MLLNEQILRIQSMMGLNENVNQAEKYLRDLGYDVANQEWLDLRQGLYDKRLNGYAGPIIKMITKKSGDSITFDGDGLEQLEKLLSDSRNLLNNLPKNLFDYTDINELKKDIEALTVKSDITKFTKLISTNKGMADELTRVSQNNELNPEELSDISYFVKASSEDRKPFLLKVNNIKSIDELFKRLNGVVTDIKTGFNFKNTISLIGGLSETSAKILYAKNDMIIVRIFDYKASELLGSKSWCIQQSEDYFNRYTNPKYDDMTGEETPVRLFYFFNFNQDVDYNLKMIGFVIDNDNRVTASHDRWDHHLNNPVGYLKTIGILPKIFELNLREKNKDIFGQLKKEVDSDSYAYRYSDRVIPRYTISYLKMVKDNKYSQNLDNIINMYESIPMGTEVYDSEKREYVKKTKTINIVAQSLTEKNFPAIQGFDKNKYIEMLKKVILSKFRMNDDTRVSIMHYLKDNGVDILNLSATSKAKKGQDLGDMEFAMLKNRGNDMSPIIQNKLAAIRRGEDVNMTTSEINYAIDNGFDKIIKKYYTDMLPKFGYEQMDYDDLNVYKKLGMLDQISGIILKKGNMYGADALNSIERSVYDYAKR